jgi:hypothetical protein
MCLLHDRTVPTGTQLGVIHLTAGAAPPQPNPRGRHRTGPRDYKARFGQNRVQTLGEFKETLTTPLPLRMIELARAPASCATFLFTSFTSGCSIVAARAFESQR